MNARMRQGLLVLGVAATTAVVGGCGTGGGGGDVSVHGSVSVGYGYGYGYGGYYGPWYPPGAVVVPPPGGYPGGPGGPGGPGRPGDRPPHASTLPSGGQMPASRPSSSGSSSMSRPPSRPMPRPMGGGGGRRR